MAGRFASSQSFSMGRNISRTMASTVLPLMKFMSAAEATGAGSGFWKLAARPAKAEAALAAAVSPTRVSPSAATAAGCVAAGAGSVGNGAASATSRSPMASVAGAS